MREKLLFDFGWLFHEGDIPAPEPKDKMPMYFHAKTERMLDGPAAYGYDERHRGRAERWESVDLPHDYIITQRPSRENNNTLGYFEYRNAWYRKHFRLEESDRERRLTLFFEGVATHATVYVNGCLMARNFCGYTSFEIDITDIARFGADNVVAVYVDATDHEGWWYEGAGIYRHVWLTKTDRVAVDLWGVYVNPLRQSGGVWQVPVETTVRNDGQETETVAVESVIVDASGREIASATGEITVPRRDKAVLSHTMMVENPALWDTEHPNLYAVRTRILRLGEPIDEVVTRFGFRTIRFDADQGFFLNDRAVKLKGVCCHQDYGLTGKAMPDRVHRYRLRRLREMGANAYRAAHYPPAEATMDALDELGFLVMDETRWFESTRDGLDQLAMMLRRDRNHPSVILWSIGNEEPLHLNEQGKRIAQTMTAFIKRYDDTRPVTSAVSNKPAEAAAMDVLEVLGVNYNLHTYDAIRERFPDRPFVAAECCAVGTTRGWYFDDNPERGYFKAWDHPVGGFAVDREHTWKHVTARPWVAGEFQWAGIEHRGETVWPRLCSQSGALDLFLQPKDAYYQNKSHWTEEPMVHILPHWNLAGREGEAIPVWVYTNCEEVELWQDGRSLGTVRPGLYGHGEWQVIYTPGCLRAEGRIGGRAVADEEVRTTGPAAALGLRLEDGGIRADGEDIAIVTCYCVDADGNPVPDASPLVSFDTNDLGRIVGTGSDVCDHTPVPNLDRRMRAGLISVAIKVGDRPGKLRVYARSEGLLAARLDIDVAPAPRRPFL
ncbi:MAG: glycoside hydrolase family 2 protein [Clostridiales bacterium]|nr:glycoside hydrolase family 2 protein [Clostridiales bacterium]